MDRFQQRRDKAMDHEGEVPLDQRSVHAGDR
jgi:hypothetical protein